MENKRIFKNKPTGKLKFKQGPLYQLIVKLLGNNSDIRSCVIWKKWVLAQVSHFNVNRYVGMEWREGCKESLSLFRNKRMCLPNIWWHFFRALNFFPPFLFRNLRLSSDSAFCSPCSYLGLSMEFTQLNRVPNAWALPWSVAIWLMNFCGLPWWLRW